MPAYVPPHLRNKKAGATPEAKEVSEAKEVPEAKEEPEFSPRRSSARDTSWGQRENNRQRQPRSNTRFQGMFDGFQGSGYNDRKRSGGGRYGGRDGGYGGGRNNIQRRAQMELDTFPNPQLERELFGETQNMVQGINFERYNDIPVEMSGENLPDGVVTFQDADVDKALMANIVRCGYTVPTPVQKFSLPIVTSRRDLMACAQTGSGKTAAFLLPMIHNLLSSEPLSLDKEQSKGRRGGYSRTKYYPRALVLAPTRELVQQIHQQARRFLYCTGMRAVCVYGGSAIVDQFKELGCGVHLLVATPGRLVDMIERGRMSLAACEFLTLDEADRMLDMGFEPQIRQIVEQSDCLRKEEGRNTLMYSATFPEDIQQLAQDFLNDYIFLAVGRVGSTTDFITQTFMEVQENRKIDELFDLLPNCEGLKLVFTATKRGADEVEYLLNSEGCSATCIHGDKTQSERERALKDFRRGNVDTLVATDVAARGLDIPNVMWVIQYDLPSTIDDYVHRIGRTGRCGNEGTAVSFVNRKNGNVLGDLLDILKESKQDVPTWLVQLRNETRRSSKGRKKGRYGGRDFRRGQSSRKHNGGHGSNNGGGYGGNNRRNNRRGNDRYENNGW